MGSLSRTKGANGEREVATMLRDNLGLDISRNLIQAREGGADLVGLDPYALEVKRAQTAPPALVAAWWAQAEDQAERAGLLPALAYRQDRGKWRFVVRLADLHPGMNAWPGLDWTATISASAFCALLRERMK